MVKKTDRKMERTRRHIRVRRKISGTAERPRLCVYRSNTNLYVQIIDDVAGNTLVSCSTLDKNIKAEKGKFSFKDILYIVVGIILIGLSAEVIVNSAVNISKWLGIGEDLIGLTIIAVGTNLPELVTSIVAVRKGEVDIAIGNLVGTNIYNIFLILGLAATINPIVISSNAFIDIIVLAITSFIVYIFIQHKKDINRKEGIIMILLYIIYIVYVVIR